MKSRYSIRILKVLLGSVFTVLLLYNAVVYFTCKRTLSHDRPIHYEIKEKRAYSGRGSYYTMAVVYKAKVYEVDITSRAYSEVDKQKYPLLFYNQTLDIVFENWKLLQAKRLMGVSAIMFLLVVLFIKGPKDKYS